MKKTKQNMNEIPNLLFCLCPDLRENIMKALWKLKKKIFFKTSSHPTHY